MQKKLIIKKTCSCGRERPTTHRSNNIQMAPHRYRGRRTYKTVHTRSGVEPFSFASRQQWLFARLSPHSAAIGHPTPPSCLMTTHLPPPISAISSPLVLTTLLHHPCPGSIPSCLTQRINLAREARAAFGWDRDSPPPPCPLKQHTDAPHRYKGRRTYETVHTRDGVEPVSISSRQQWPERPISP